MGKSKQIIDSKEFSNFIETTKIFEETLNMMKEYLNNWYIDDTEDFLECMGDEGDVVLNEYTFFNQSVHFVKNFNFVEPDQDFIYCIIDIKDKEGDIRRSFKAVFDYNLTVEDTMMF